MIDERDLLEEALRRFEPDPGLTDRIYRRRDRKRRNQRIAAGVVGIAVFVAAVWIVTSVGWLDRSEKSVVPAGTGPVQTGPAETGPTETRPAETGPTETGPVETAPPSAPASAGPDMVRKTTCSDGAILRLELTDLGDHIKVRVEVHRSPVGHSWDIELRHASGIMGGGPGSFLAFFEGTRVASESGDLTVQRRVWNSSMMDRVVARVRDRQTGQFGIICHVGAGPL